MSNRRRLPASPRQAHEERGRPSRIRFAIAAAPGLGPVPGLSPGPADQWLASYDPEGRDGYGAATWTPDPARAQVFPTGAAAFETWRAVPRCRPLRDDGLPNRPLTMFTVVIEPVPGDQGSASLRAVLTFLAVLAVLNVVLWTIGRGAVAMLGTTALIALTLWRSR